MSTDSSAPQSAPDAQSGPPQGIAGATDDGRVYVVTPNSMAVEGPAGAERSDTDGDGEPDGPRSVTEMVEQPAKVMRIGTMIRQLLEEVKAAPLDDAGRQRLGKIHQASIAELKDGLAPELVEELERITLPFTDEATPSDAELRIAQAQLVGWLEGLFHGIQTALFAQQMATRAQLDQMRRALPPGVTLEGESAPDTPSQRGSEGMYL